MAVSGIQEDFLGRFIYLDLGCAQSPESGRVDLYQLGQNQQLILKLWLQLRLVLTVLQKHQTMTFEVMKTVFP